MALTLGFGYAAAMISAKVFPYQVDSLGFHGTMWVHAAISAVMTLWAMVTLQGGGSAALSRYFTIAASVSKHPLQEISNQLRIPDQVERELYMVTTLACYTVGLTLI